MSAKWVEAAKRYRAANKADSAPGEPPSPFQQAVQEFGDFLEGLEGVEARKLLGASGRYVELGTSHFGGGFTWDPDCGEFQEEPSNTRYLLGGVGLRSYTSVGRSGVLSTSKEASVKDAVQCCIESLHWAPEDVVKNVRAALDKIAEEAPGSAAS